jgi:betaine-aldehyde dehydrogenase
LWKCAPALAAGNTFIFKPSEVTPLSAYILAEILTEAGLPPGVFNLVHGAGSVGAALCTDPRVAKVSFTGQPSTGIAVYTSAAKTLKPVTLELGGKSPFIVFPDADLNAAADCCVTANFYSSGQVCTNGTRVFVHKDVFSEFQKLLVQKTTDFVRAGDPMHKDVNFGPVVSKQHYEKVLGYIEHGVREDKATLLLGGLEKPSHLAEPFSKGYYIKPTIFTDCHDSMKIVREEIFGPVACLLEFETMEEVIRRANDTELGLAAGVFTKDLNTANKVMAEVHAGICWVNTWGESPAQMPVGGWGYSGVGFENGVEALGQFVKNKSVLVENGEVAPAFAKL